MNLKKVITSALTLALALGITACGSSNKDENSNAVSGNETSQQETENTTDEKATVVFWHAMNGEQEKELTKLADDFMKEHPDITIELQNQTGYQELQQKITATSTSPDDLPTMTQAYPDWMFNPIKDGLVQDLTDLTKDIEDYDDILEGFRKGTEFDGKVYSMPFNKSTEILWYNKDIFDELKLDVPTSYEELEDVSKKITEEKGIPAIGWDSLSNYYTTFIANEGKDFDKDFDVTSDESKKAVEYYLDGIKDGYFRTAGTDKYMSGPFGNEQVAMYIGSNAGETFVKEAVADKFNVGVAPAPTGKAVQQGTDVFVFANKPEAETKAAYEFIKYITSKDAQIEWGIKTGYIPARESSIEADEYQNSGSLIGPVIKDATKDLFTTPVVAGADQAYQEAGTMMETVLADPDSDVDKQLENFQSTLDGIWE